MSEIRAATVLPAKRTRVTLPTADGLRLVGELALPADADPVATLICLHPLPTHGGMMDSHLLKKAAFRLPALAQLAVLRFNTRGTSSEHGTSEGEFGDGESERYDVAAGMSWAADAGLPARWLLGWSFGTELALRWGLDGEAGGARHRGRHPAVPAAAPGRRRRPGPLGGLGQAARRAGSRARRLPAPRRGPAAVRAGASGRGRRGPRGQAPVGRGALRAHRAERDRAPGQPGRAGAAYDDATDTLGGIVTAFDLTGKKAFVTGASRGIGRIIAVALAAAGADVAIAARSQDGLAETAREVTDLGRKAFVFPLDVTRQDDVTAAVHEAIRLLGQLDIVVNNAGGMNFMVPFLDMRISGWEKVMRLNLDSTIYVCQAAGAHMRERGRGSVINVASVAGMSGAPGLSPYGASKAAVISVTKTLAVEWAASGIRVNALCPGWTATDLNRNLWDGPDGGRSTIANVPMGRWGRPAEMAGPAVFLASDASSYMTGQVLVVDGGQLATA